MDEIRHSHRAVYEANAGRWDAERSRSLFEKHWLDRLLAHVPAGGSVLDLGCGAGEPIARYLIERGYAVTGVDFSSAMLAIARSRFPNERWIEAEMRSLDLDERFAGIVAWDSFFHLARDEQREMIPRMARHLLPGGAMLLTVGPDDGEARGRVGDDEVYHASLSPAEYADRLDAAGLTVASFVADDPACGGHSVLLAVARTDHSPSSQSPGGLRGGFRGPDSEVDSLDSGSPPGESTCAWLSLCYCEAIPREWIPWTPGGFPKKRA